MGAVHRPDALAGIPLSRPDGRDVQGLARHAAEDFLSHSVSEGTLGDPDDPHSPVEGLVEVVPESGLQVLQPDMAVHDDGVGLLRDHLQEAEEDGKLPLVEAAGLVGGDPAEPERVLLHGLGILPVREDDGRGESGLVGVVVADIGCDDGRDDLLLREVPRAGVEPARPLGHSALNAARLPLRHLGKKSEEGWIRTNKSL